MQPSSHNQLQQLIQGEKELVANLLELLKHEEQVLVKRDVDGIEKAVAAKQLIISELEKLAVERSNVLKNNGCSDDKEGFEGYLSQLDERTSTALEQEWEQLQELLKSCQDQNQVNGHILDSSRRNTEKALSLLVGKGEEGDTRLYDEKGATDKSIGGQSHVKV